MGLLDFAMYDDPESVGRLAFGAGLLNAAGPSKMPISFGQALASGLMGAQNASSEAAMNKRRNALTDLQMRRVMQEMDMQKQQANMPPQLFGKINPSDFTPESLSTFERTQRYGDLVLNPRNAKEPASVLEWKEFMAMTPPEQARYLEMKRSPQVKDVNNVPSIISQGNVKPLSTVESEAASGAAIAGAKKSAEAKAAGAAQAELDLPSAEARLPVLEKQVNELLKHPGRKFGTGVMGVVPPMPGTPMADFVSRLDQLKSVAFLQAFETLKGGGQITEIEGKKATDAINRMSRTSTDKEFEAAAKDFLDAYKAGLEKLRSKRRSYPSGYMDPAEQARTVRGYDGMPGDRVDRVPGSDPLGIR